MVSFRSASVLFLVLHVSTALGDATSCDGRDRACQTSSNQLLQSRLAESEKRELLQRRSREDSQWFFKKGKKGKKATKEEEEEEHNPLEKFKNWFNDTATKVRTGIQNGLNNVKTKWDEMKEERAKKKQERKEAFANWTAELADKLNDTVNDLKEIATDFHQNVEAAVENAKYCATSMQQACEAANRTTEMDLETVTDVPNWFAAAQDAWNAGKEAADMSSAGDACSHKTTKSGVFCCMRSYFHEAAVAGLETSQQNCNSAEDCQDAMEWVAEGCVEAALVVASSDGNCSGAAQLMADATEPDSWQARLCGVLENLETQGQIIREWKDNMSETVAKFDAVKGWLDDLSLKSGLLSTVKAVLQVCEADFDELDEKLGAENVNNTAKQLGAENGSEQLVALAAGLSGVASKVREKCDDYDAWNAEVQEAVEAKLAEALEWAAEKLHEHAANQSHNWSQNVNWTRVVDVFSTLRTINITAVLADGAGELNQTVHQAKQCASTFMEAANGTLQANSPNAIQQMMWAPSVTTAAMAGFAAANTSANGTVCENANTTVDTWECLSGALAESAVLGLEAAMESCETMVSCEDALNWLNRTAQQSIDAGLSAIENLSACQEIATKLSDTMSFLADMHASHNTADVPPLEGTLQGMWPALEGTFES